MSETQASNRLQCVCGKNLRIPDNASVKAKNGKCPKCHAPFEFGDGGWVCVAAGIFASNSPVPEGALSSKSTIANLAALVDQNDYANDIAITTPPTSEPHRKNDNTLSKDATVEPAMQARPTTITEVHGEQYQAGTSDLEKSGGRALEAAGVLYLESTPINEDILSNPTNDSEAARRHVSGAAQLYLPHFAVDATNELSANATGHRDLKESACSRLPLPEHVVQEQTSLFQVDSEEGPSLPSTSDWNYSGPKDGHAPQLTSTDSPAFDSSMLDSLVPAIAPEPAYGNCRDDGARSQTPADIRKIKSQEFAEDKQSEQSLPRVVKTSLCHDAQAEEPVGYNWTIRKSLANSLELDRLFPEHVVAAITLACHPWPDVTISQNDIDIISAELRPGLNINHPSMLEIAVDRLLRFANALRFAGSIELAETYANAALTIESHKGTNASGQRYDSPANKNIAFIASPIGLSVASPRSVSTPANESTVSEYVDWHSTIISLLGAAVFRGSRDTGIALGSEETGVSVSRLAEKLGVILPEKQFDEHLDRLDDRVLDILASRRFKLGLPDTLADIAARWKITRERVRQIETKASDMLLDRFAATFKRLGKQSISTLSFHVFRVDVLYAIATRIAGYSRHRDILSGFLADIFGPWQKTGHWIYHSSLQDRVEKLRESLPTQVDSYGVIAAESIIIGCEGLFLTEVDRDQFLREEFGFGNYFGIWTSKNTMRCQVVAALRKIGRPATKEELAEMLEHPPERIGSILTSIDGVVRADRYRWGFDEWIEDAYDGIYAEIEQRINEYNGSVPIQVIMSEIPAQFNVAENSVKAYLASSAFVVDNGMVRMASNEDYAPRSPSRCPDAIRIGNKWGYRSLIYDRHFNGYSLGVNFDVAFANGLRPGDDLVVPVEGSAEEVSLIWRLQNLSRLVDVGRVANYLMSKGVKAGETLILIPSREKIEIVHERELQSRFPELKFQIQFDTYTEGHQSKNESSGGEVFDPLLDLLGGDQ